MISMQLRSPSLPCSRCGAATLLAAVAVLAVALPAAAQPTVEYALGLAPFQKNVDYDKLTPDQAMGATLKMEKEGGLNAWVVRGPRGEVLRSFADTNADKVVDRWSYFKDGMEVYRDIDADFNAKADQARWVNIGGSRWGLDEDENGTLDAWKSLSAEEATAEIVAALKARDPALFTRLLPTKDDLVTAGFEEPLLSELVARAAKAGTEFASLAKAQQQIGADVQWNNMLAPQPGVLPVGTPGVAKDVLAYDNVVALIDAGAKGASGQVYVGSLVRCGDVWRPIDAPQVPGAQGEIAETLGFFTPRMSAGTANGEVPAENEALKPLLAKLRELDGALRNATGKDREAAAAEQIEVLEQVVAGAEADQKSFYTRQLAETIAIFVQEGTLTGGTEKLEAIVAGSADDEPLQAFAAFRLSQARYAAAMQEPGADLGELQKAWIEELAAFVKDHPTAADAAEAILQMGMADEFNDNEKNALARYEAIVKEFPESGSAKKARGASRRLQSVGKTLALSGTAVDGSSVSLESLKGVPVLVHYWATWCEPCKVDIAQIKELYTKYGPKKFAVVGIALDTDKAQLAKYLGQKPIPWPQLHEAGGLDGRLAEELGVLTLPTMFLLDAEGKVVDRNLVIADLEKKLEEMVGQ
jgi:thiol-disulfide isomerase/thioredoxin